MANIPATTVTSDQLGSKIGASGAEAERLYTEAVDTVTEALATAWRDVPVSAVDECVYRVGRALKDSGRTSTGAGQMTATDAPGPRNPTDPLASAYPIIRRYVVLGV
jgi:hypothetical protein